MTTQTTCSVCGYVVRTATATRRCPKCGADVVAAENGEHGEAVRSVTAPPPPPPAPPPPPSPADAQSVPVRVIESRQPPPHATISQASARGKRPWAAMAVMGIAAMIVVALAWRIDDTSSGRVTGAPKEKRKADDRKRVNKESPRTEDAPRAPAAPLRPKSFAEHLARIEPAMVKIEIRVGRELAVGGGFVIDDRGLVATNDHVLGRWRPEVMRVVLEDGNAYRVQRIVARAPDRDMAILQIANPPADLKAVDLSYRGTPDKGARVYAYGHPHNNDFSVTEGIVSKVLTTAELPESAARFVVRGTSGDLDHIWIQTDAKISPGNSGGPLISEAGEIIGMNTWVNTQVDFGYASHVRYLRELISDIR